MRFPWVNLVLLIVLIVQLVTGYLGLIENRESFRWILWLHGIGAYALVVLLYWKSQVIFDAWRRKTVWTGARKAFLVLLGLLLLTIVLGLAWTFAGPIYLFGFSLVSLHIYIAIPLMVLMLWHFWRMRFVLRLPQTRGRRLLLGLVGPAALGLLLWRVVAWSKEQLQLPGATRRFTGSFETGSFTGRFPVVSWIADRPPPVDVDGWRLSVGGEVEQTLQFTYEQLREIAEQETTAVLDCTGGWYTVQVWRGIPVACLLDRAGLQESAASVTFRAVSGYKRRFSIVEARRYLIALDVAEAPLTHGHGFPARLVAPDQRGVEWVKWLEAIDVNVTGPEWQAPLPLM